MKVIELTLQRLFHDIQSTLGIFFIEGKRQCFTLEDEPRKIKVKGETRIPAGRYQITMDQPSSKDKKYFDIMKKYGKVHHGMLRLLDVPGFQGILIHIGNFETDTDGCILVGETAGMDVNGWNKVITSTDVYIRLYSKISNELLNGNKVFITVMNECI